MSLGKTHAAHGNLILNADSYKSSHFLQYPPDAEVTSFYVEARTGKPGAPYPDTLFFGLQAFLKEYLSRPITAADLDEAREVLTAHGLPFNEAGWQRIVEHHGGMLPLDIQALPEGSVVPRGTALAQICNTDPALPWLPSYIETALLRAIWYPTTVATYSWSCKQVIAEALAKSSDQPEAQLPFKLHDFGARGVSSQESAGIGGLAHLVNFSGTDTLAALITARRWYGAEMAGFSIPAAEHSTITTWGREHEREAYGNMLDRFGAGPLLSIVSDSYDLANAVTKIFGQELREKILTMNATLVVRPDSGDPRSVVPDTIQRLIAAFGASRNSKGYLVLNPKIRVIQGDGVTLSTIREILDLLLAAGISAENVTFGMGGALLQVLNRDTLRFAMKANAIRMAGAGWTDVYKEPATDPSKRSQAGRLAVVRVGNGWKTVRADELAGRENQLKSVWRDGKLLVDWSFDDVRRQADETTALLKLHQSEAA
jgi:nicotinamide phosphoribosyltransferase